MEVWGEGILKEIYIRQFTRNRPIDTGIADFFLCVKKPSLREVKKLA